jgi:STE24 endopeptidase
LFNGEIALQHRELLKGATQPAFPGPWHRTPLGGRYRVDSPEALQFQCDAANADPVCELSPYYGLVTDAVAQADRPLATEAFGVSDRPQLHQPVRRELSDAWLNKYGVRVTFISWLAQGFVIAVVAETGIRLWLTSRQLQAVRSHRNAVPSVFQDQITLEDQQRAADYTVARVALGRWATIYEGFLKLVLTVGGGVGLVDTLWRRNEITEPWRGMLLIGSLLLLLQLAGLPFEIWRTFKIEARFGFNRVTPRLFAIDLVKGVGLGVLLGGPLLLMTLMLMQRDGEWWWLWAWCAWLAWTIVMTWAAPRYIAPLFNRFSPLADEALKKSVEALLARCGFSAAGGVFVMDGSRRSTHGNAYFTGIGRNKRIVLFDTLLERMDTAEIEAVLAHELGHFRLHHIIQRLILSALLTLAGLALLAWTARQPVFYQAFHVSVPSAESALILCALIAPVITFFAKPFVSWLSRRQELAADDFAVAHADRKRLATALVKLLRHNSSTLTPDHLHSAFYDSHPPALARIVRLNALAGPVSGNG